MLHEYNYHTRVMGCDFDMTFVTSTREAADKCFMQAMKIAQFYEKKFSRFDENSELAQLNEKKTMKVTKSFMDIYMIAYDLYKKTNGGFNPLLQVERIGYDRTFERMEKEIFADDDLFYDTNMEYISVKEGVFFLRNDQKIDFGGFLKGCVAQKICEHLTECNGVIINIGGDLYVGGKDHLGDQFIIEIEHPYDNKKNISVVLENRSLCTSGTYKRKWNKNNIKKHHILSSGTKDSVDNDVFSVSVVHPSGAIADAFATYGISLGTTMAKEFFALHKVDFVIMCTDGTIIKSDIFK